ncbi:MAG: hypothetical protein Q9160_007022 [Pyrenula sp. 1 TL-2023]
MGRNKDSKPFVPDDRLLARQTTTSQSSSTASSASAPSSSEPGDVTSTGPPIFGNIPNQDNGNYSLELLANHPPERPSEWVGLGDSFAAGPGAGAELNRDPVEIECKRGANGYPNSLQNSDEIPGPDDPNMGPSKPRFTFKACTGDITTDLTDNGKPNYQMRAVGPGTTFVTLSIGGNDVKFSEILEKCIYGRGGDPDCNTRLQNARDVLYSPDMHRNYINVIYQILENMQYRRRASVRDKRTAIYVTSYPQFFDAYTTQCNDVNFLPIVPAPIGAPKLTQDLRASLNRLTHEVNYVIAYWLDVYNVGYTVPRDNNINLRYGTAIDIVDVDPIYDQHRFCRDGVTEPDRRVTDTWFFHYSLPGTLDAGTYSDQSLDNDFKEMTDPKIAESTRVIRTFHPKSAGHQATRDLMIFKLLYNSGMVSLGSKYLDIMVIGDSIPYGSADPRREIYEGFIPHLTSLLHDYRLFPTAGGVGHTFIGTQSTPYVGHHDHEMYPGVKLDELWQKVQSSDDMHLQGKVVLLCAGTYDVLEAGDNFDPAALADKLAKIIDYIYKNDPNAVVFVAQVPLVGANDDGHFFSNAQKNIIRYNGAIAALVNQLRTQNRYKIMKIHLTTTTYEHDEGSFIMPSKLGYLRMAFDWLQGLVMADKQGWLDPFARNSDQSDPWPNILPSPVSFPNPSQPYSCHQPRQTSAPSRDKLVHSLTGGLGFDDWITKVACNSTAICAHSLNSNHIQYNDATMNNGTQCLWAGANDDGGSNPYQITLRQANASTPLDQTVCRHAITTMFQCILDGSMEGVYWNDGSFEFNITNLIYPNNPLAPIPGTVGIPESLASSVLKSTWSPPPVFTTNTADIPSAAATQSPPRTSNPPAPPQ